jgi:cytochrome c peroxidase
MGAEINPEGKDWGDEGLGRFLAGRPATAALAAENMGKHKVPTLRNVDKRPEPAFVKAYMHNGFFKSLPDVVRFYNARDKGGFPPPEVEANVNRDEMGNLGLTEAEEGALVAFLRTLSD